MSDLAEAVEKAAQALHDHRALRCRALHGVGQPLRDSIYDDECRAEARAALEAALPLIVREVKAEALEEALHRLARAAFAVDSKHHLRGVTCLCGFEGDARARTQTEHITSAVIDEYDHD